MLDGRGHLFVTEWQVVKFSLEPVPLTFHKLNILPIFQKLWMFFNTSLILTSPEMSIPHRISNPPDLLYYIVFLHTKGYVKVMSNETDKGGKWYQSIGLPFSCGPQEYRKIL